jgi:hypothetical protein
MAAPYNFLVNNNFYQGTSDACIIDVTPPTFAGINFLDVESRGQIRAGWSAATDPTPPIRYEVYIQASTATGLFNTTNIVALTPNLQYDIFTLPNGSFLQNGVTYFVGVRAIDGVNNRDSNTVSQSVISTGVLTSIDTYQVNASFSNDSNDEFNVTAWANKNNSLAIAPSAILGTANYEVFDDLGNSVPGMSGSGVTANSEGLFVFPVVSDVTDRLNNHYQIRVGIVVDSEERVNFVPVPSFEKNYRVEGSADINETGQIVGSFWINRNDLIVTTGLGTGSYQVYDVEGNVIPLSESGITADPNGFFVITPTTFPGPLDVTRAFIIRASIEVDGVVHNQNLILGNEPEVFDNKAVFSINALNQLRATFWTTKNNQLQSGATLGTASYQVYDASGAPVAGLTQSGITADSNGYFHITPVLATLITDLTHYTVKITINVAGQNRVSTRAFTLLGT